MKKRMLMLAAALLLLFARTGLSRAEAPARKDLKITMQLSETQLHVGDTIRVEITITNTSDHDFTEAMALLDPNGKQIRDFGDPVLKKEETASWSGEWTATEKNLKDERITFTVKYVVITEKGKTLMTKHFSRKITALESETAPEPTPEPRPEDFDDVLLYGVYRPNPSTGKVAVGCVDRGGNVWITEKADVPWPALDKDVREMLRTRRGMRKYENLIGSTVDGTVMNDAWFSSVVADMISAIPQPEERPRKTGIDVGQEAVWGLRKNENGEEESVLLGMAGSYLYENPSPDAQRLYLFMWREMKLTEIFNAAGICYATEGVSPRGFRGITVREFYGLADGDLSRASVSAVWLDAEDGPAEKKLSPEEAEELRALADRGMIIRKESVWSMPEDVLTCTFTDEQGTELGQIRLFSYTTGTNEDGENIIQTLAVADDGMYQFAVEPRPVDTLTEAELRMMTVRIEGVDYTVGKSTPRDLISHGWNCFPEWTGVFTCQDPEWNNTLEITTAGGSPDEPITHISCQFAYEADIEYCGYDGIADPGTSICYPLSDGRYLYLFSNASPVVITLSEHGPDEDVW